MKQPKVSICIPAYNDAVALERLLKSIACQDFNDYEIVISDDSTTEEVREIVEHYASLPIVYQKNEKSLGSPENWNQAIRLASGEYIKIMHNDDSFSRPDSLRKLVGALDSHPEASFAFSACRDIGEGIDILRKPSAFQLSYLTKAPDVLLLGNFIGAPSTTIFRNSLDEYFDKELIWKVDVDFYVRFLKKYPEFVYIDDDLLTIGISPKQISRQCEENNDLIAREDIYIKRKLSPRYPFVYRFAYDFRYRFLSSLIKQIKKK